ncbi:hypothetical protein ACFRFL_13550 [Streptomyces sp. NPDC056708]|uniref:hypothetical protein n=1 Tax=unclassified Streptomyces TaxID=2593676 RepID=UPI0036BF44B6
MPGTGVAFEVPGPDGVVDSAARFDGTANACLDAGAAIADTGRNFTASAWVRPAALDRNTAVLIGDSSAGRSPARREVTSP